MKNKFIIRITFFFAILGVIAFLVNYLNKEDQVEAVGYDDTFYAVNIDSFEEMCEWSDTIVKAKYIRRESFNEYTDIFVFKPEEDFIGNVDEKRIHVYEVKDSSFIEGKSYYLFMASFRSPLYPHVSYARTRINFLVGEVGKGDSRQYTFYNDYSLGLDKVDDISKYIETEIIAKDAYMKPENNEESLDDAINNADAIYKIKMESVKQVNRFVSSCTYSVTETLKERYSVSKSKELPSVLVPASAKKGDEFIILVKYNEDYQNYEIDYSSQHYILEVRDFE